MNRLGDWNCRSCQHLNFQRRESCQRCGEFRSADHFGGRGGSSFGFTTGSDVRPGDWYCTAGNCGTHNFASRSSCFKCGAFKDDSAGGFDGDVLRSRGVGGGRDAMSTTLQAEWNVSDAVPQEASAIELPTKNTIKFWALQTMRD
ncbi:Ran BP2/NZF zinc finger-like superfamily protein isoform 3 [Hibiscus syriacus]|uniref:Ran BP2/NZF zinc finger-like superfamily protein isoform 3 n=1 Tax=Hibiscus syriacus TaxID=106335 RepID=A0A6A3B5N2_HIBSY|nr:Ran BP2/NZF zinc finger-like superfamily protein isoform 3 [Hibiscus syriacus]